MHLSIPRYFEMQNQQDKLCRDARHKIEVKLF
jgi:hypothetical protein